MTTMGKGRLEAFSDGVLAIIITIMVLEFKVPHTPDLAGLVPVLPHLFAYVLSFVFLAIYWNNHHHMLQAAQHVSGAILWANMHLLFWLSLVPFTTAWMGENHFASMPTAVYGLILLMAAIAYSLLQLAILKEHGKRESLLARAIGNDLKGKMSLVLYAAAIFVAPFLPWISQAIYIFVALMWLVPDRRIEKILSSAKT